MKNSALAIWVCTLISLPAFAQTAAPTSAPAVAPAGMMHLMCKDGTSLDASTTHGACSGHGGIDKKAMAKMPEGMPAKSSPMADKPAKTTPTPMEQAPGGGDGKVWLNDSTKVYHCQADKYYGKTKHGEYLTEAEAKAKGAHASHGKACSK